MCVFFVVVGHEANIDGDEHGKDECLHHAHQDLVKVEYRRDHIGRLLGHAGKEAFAAKDVTIETEGKRNGPETD
mgnify:CR=1 FL=1